MNKKMNINLKTIGALFFAILLFFIFFSKTIYQYNLPVVTGTLPKSEQLTKAESTIGITDWETKEELYAQKSGKIENILVKEGQKVKKGQELIHIGYDETSMIEKLKEIDMSKKKIALDLETIQQNLEKAKNEMAALEKEHYEKEPISTFEQTNLQNKITLKTEELAKTKILYDAGITTKQALENVDNELNDLKNQLQNLLMTNEQKEKKAEEDLAKKYEDNRKQLADYRNNISAFEQSLKAKKLDLASLALQEESQKNALTTYQENTVIYAKEDATIVSIPVKKGQNVNENQLILVFGMGNTFQIECNIPLDNNFINISDVCQLSNQTHLLKGLVTKITPSETAKKLTITVSSDELSTGETLTAKFEKQSNQMYTLVPNGAIHKDADGYFVYQINRREGILGKEYFAQKLRVYIGDSNMEYTVITKGLDFYEPLVLYSNKNFSENETIKLKNEGDFFEK